MNLSSSSKIKLIFKLILINMFLLLAFNKDVYASDTNTELLNQYMDKLPNNLLEKFYSLDWNVYLTEENLSKKYFNGIYSFVYAVTDFKEQDIYIFNDETSIKVSTIHEFGHFVDTYFNNISKSSEFDRIWKEEKYNFVSLDGSSSNRYSAKEYFAEAFQETILNPDIMKINTPQTYNFMTALNFIIENN